MQRSSRTPSSGGISHGLWLLLVTVILAGCAGPGLEDYSDMEPALTPQTFFTGELSARGVVKNRSGKVIRTFDADISASWNDQSAQTSSTGRRVDV